MTDRLDAAAAAGFRQNQADMMARGKFPPKIEWTEADDATRAAWRSVAAATIEAWEAGRPA